MSNVKEIYVRAVTNVSGSVYYVLYNDIDCSGEIVEEGLMQSISPDNYERFISPQVTMNNEFSIKVIDSNECESCLNQILPPVTPIIIPATPFPTSTIIVTITPTPEPTPTPPVEVSGTCYTLTIDNTALTQNFQELYIEKIDPISGQIINQSYSMYPAISEIDTIIIKLCSTVYPLFSYGEFGGKITTGPEITIVIGGVCQLDGECV
jgi:hypothetical protein